MIRVFNDWALLQLTGECPFTFTKDEFAKHEEEVKRHEDRVYLQALARTQLCTDDDGWVPLHDWEATTAMNQYLLNMFIETMAEEISGEEAVKMWPFSEESNLSK